MASFYSRNLCESSEFQIYNINKIISFENVRTDTASALPKEVSVAVFLSVLPIVLQLC